MFDLEKGITDWRRQMLAAGIKSPVPLDELEGHLREEIERQMRSGLSAEKALESAARKIGPIYVLQTEFAKVGGAEASTRWERWLAVFISAGAIIPLGIYGLLKDEMSLGWRLAGFANFVALALSILGWRYINKSFPIIPDKRVRRAVGLSFGLTGMTGMIIFMTFILPNFEFTNGQMTVMVLWGLTLMAVCGGVWAGLEEAARKQIATSN